MKIIKQAGIIAVSALLVIGAIRLVQAGTLTPNASTASTMHSFQEVYDSLVGNFNSATSTASSTGNVIQIARCIATKISGGICP